MIATKFKTTSSRLVAMTIVDEENEIMVVSANGIVTRIKASDISQQGRPATGVRIQNLVDSDYIVGVNKIVNPEEDEKIKADDKAADEAEAQGAFIQGKLTDTAGIQEIVDRAMAPDEETPSEDDNSKE